MNDAWLCPPPPLVGSPRNREPMHATPRLLAVCLVLLVLASAKLTSLQVQVAKAMQQPGLAGRQFA